jgi:hypothetical protein
MIIFFASFIEDWIVQSPKKTARAMLSGDYEAAQWLAENIENDREVIVSRKLSEPQIYIAYVNSWDPASYQQATKGWLYKESNLAWVDQFPEYHLGNYTFKDFYWPVDKNQGAVFVGKPEDFPSEIEPLKVFYYPNDEAAIYIVDAAPMLYAYENK